MVRTIPTPPPETSHTRDRIVNALEMGTCDGQYYTDHQIRQAFDELQTEGSVYIPQGTWVISKPIVWPGNNIKVFGAGNSTILSLADGADCDIFDLDGISRVVMRDLQFNGNKANNAAGSAMNIYNCVNVILDNIHAWNTSDEGIHFEAAGGNGTVARLYNVYTSGCDGAGIFIDDWNGATLHGCVTEGAATGTSAQLMVKDSIGVGIYDHWCEGTFGDGIHLNNVDSFVLSQIRIQRGETNGLHLDDASGTCTNGHIFAVRTSDSGTRGLLIDATCARLKFQGCEFDTAISYAGTGVVFEGVAIAGAAQRTVNSGTSTGTAAQQTIAHGCITTPVSVQLWDIETGAGPYQSAAADAVNIYVTAANNQDWGWRAVVAEG